MRERFRRAPGRLGVHALVVWLLLATVGPGFHAAGAGTAGRWAGDVEHQPWHRHVLNDGMATHAPGLDYCAVCLLKGEAGALVTDLVAALGTDDSPDFLPRDSVRAGRLRTRPGAAPRAPPTG